MNDMLHDESVYKKINNDPTLKLMKKNNDFVKQVKLEKVISKKTAKWLSNNNVVAPKIYGLPKIHKMEHHSDQLLAILIHHFTICQNSSITFYQILLKKKSII